LQVAKNPKILQAPMKFEECHKDSCVFCNRDVHFGLRGGTPEVIHQKPPCLWFEHCETAQQFAMFTHLKMRADAGILERN
jgi:hypothetical protein